MKSPFPLPGAGATHTRRDATLARVEASIARALAGQGDTLLLVGEPGIGKTHTAERALAAAADRGARVATGRSHPGEGAPPFWPWLQALRALAADGAEPLREAELLIGGAHPAVPGDPNAGVRFPLFQDVLERLRATAALRPVVVLLDDVHGADEPSLQLLRFLAREIRGAHVLVVATAREAGLGDAHPLRAAREDLTATELRIPGLEPAEVAALVQETVGEAPSDELLQALCLRTEGNPLFVIETVRWLAADGDLVAPADRPLPLPASVGQAIGLRLAALSSATLEVLSVAAVIGREFEHDVLVEATARGGAADPESALAEARGARVVEDGHTGLLRFRHGLLAEECLARLEPAAAARWHGCVADAIEALRGAHIESYLARLAHHAFEAASLGRGKQAVEYAMRAAAHASERLAHEDAVALLELALRAIERLPRGELADPTAARAEALVRLGAARWSAGWGAAARSAAREAAELARKADEPEILTRAALVLAGRTDVTMDVDHVTVGLLEEALIALPPTATALRAEATARLATALYFQEDSERSRDLSQHAQALAEEVGDPGLLAYVLTARAYCTWSPSTVAERGALAARSVELARQARARCAEALGLYWSVLHQLEVGDLTALDRALASYCRLAREIREPFHEWQATAMRAMRAIASGALEEAERLAHEAIALGERAESANATTLFATQLFLIRREQGRLAELEPAFRTAAQDLPALSPLRLALPHLLAEIGRHGEARVLFGPALEELLASGRRDGLWLTSLAVAARTCVELCDVERAGRVHKELLPFAHLSVPIGFAQGWDGAVSLYVGMLERLLGQRNAARGHLEHAAALHRRAGALPLLRRTEQELADLEGSATSRLDGPASLANEGDAWKVRFAGRDARIRDAKGVRCLALLLAEPGREFHCLDLAAEGSPAPAGGTPLEPLDGRARDAYRLRIADLRDRLADAEESSDVGRASTTREELLALEDELARAYGLGGRPRRTRDPVERARKLVYRRLHTAIARIARAHPELAAHLERSVETGTYCAYRPHPPVEWRLRSEES